MSIFRVFTGTITSGASSCQIDTGGATFARVFLELPTMSTAAAIDVYASLDGTTYYPLFERVNTAPVQYQTLTVASGVGTGGGQAPLAVSAQYVQLRASAVVSGGVIAKLICHLP